MTKILNIEEMGSTCYLSKPGEEGFGRRLARAFQAKNKVVDQYKTGLDLCPLGAFIDDREGQCMFVNQALACITGTNDMGEERWLLTIVPEDRAKVERCWHEYCAGEKGDHYECVQRFQHAETGEVTPCKVTASRLESGDYVGFVEPLCACAAADAMSI